MAKKNTKSKPAAPQSAGAKPKMPGPTVLASAGDLGRAVRAARAARGLTQDDVADKAKVSRKFVIDVENGKDSLHLGKVLKVLTGVGLAGMVVPR
jgi:HTH-type transcriptional regulator/antitoxin HipB